MLLRCTRRRLFSAGSSIVKHVSRAKPLLLLPVRSREQHQTPVEQNAPIRSEYQLPNSLLARAASEGRLSDLLKKYLDDEPTKLLMLVKEAAASGEIRPPVLTIPELTLVLHHLALAFERSGSTGAVMGVKHLLSYIRTQFIECLNGNVPHECLASCLWSLSQLRWMMRGDGVMLFLQLISQARNSLKDPVASLVWTPKQLGILSASLTSPLTSDVLNLASSQISCKELATLILARAEPLIEDFDPGRLVQLLYCTNRILAAATPFPLFSQAMSLLEGSICVMEPRDVAHLMKVSERMRIEASGIYSSVASRVRSSPHTFSIVPLSMIIHSFALNPAFSAEKEPELWNALEIALFSCAPDVQSTMPLVTAMRGFTVGGKSSYQLADIYGSMIVNQAGMSAVPTAGIKALIDFFVCQRRTSRTDDFLSCLLRESAKHFVGMDWNWCCHMMQAASTVQMPSFNLLRAFGRKCVRSGSNLSTENAAHLVQSLISLGHLAHEFLPALLRSISSMDLSEASLSELEQISAAFEVLDGKMLDLCAVPASKIAAVLCRRLDVGEERIVLRIQRLLRFCVPQAPLCEAVCERVIEHAFKYSWRAVITAANLIQGSSTTSSTLIEVAGQLTSRFATLMDEGKLDDESMATFLATPCWSLCMRSHMVASREKAIRSIQARCKNLQHLSLSPRARAGLCAAIRTRLPYRMVELPRKLLSQASEAASELDLQELSSSLHTLSVCCTASPNIFSFGERTRLALNFFEAILKFTPLPPKVLLLAASNLAHMHDISCPNLWKRVWERLSLIPGRFYRSNTTMHHILLIWRLSHSENDASDLETRRIIARMTTFVGRMAVKQNIGASATGRNATFFRALGIEGALVHSSFQCPKSLMRIERASLRFGIGIDTFSRDPNTPLDQLDSSMTFEQVASLRTKAWILHRLGWCYASIPAHWIDEIVRIGDEVHLVDSKVAQRFLVQYVKRGGFDPNFHQSDEIEWNKIVRRTIGPCCNTET